MSNRIEIVELQSRSKEALAQRIEQEIERIYLQISTAANEGENGTYWYVRPKWASKVIEHLVSRGFTVSSKTVSPNYDELLVSW